ncbi:ArdC family protein [Alienimonas sp. DA493]|uniref:ArdC family protein n=1 Tax=Alienimonas sp. DA493 TaxID=3373605 RepID=UPI003753FB12
MASQDDIRTQITQQIVEALESGDVPPWRRPWAGGGLPQNAATGNRYGGVNVLLLQHASLDSGFASPLWATYRQWQSAGCQVGRGRRGTKIVFYRPLTKVVTDRRTGEEREESFPLLKTYSVFNLDQVEGEVVERLRAEHAGPIRADFVDFGPAEEAIRATEADVRFGGDRAFYDRTGDYVQMPHKRQFDPPHEFYTVLFHELAHWCGHPLRLNRAAGDRFGDSRYAQEELVAELTSAYLLAETGVPQSDDLGGHNAYVASWLKALHNDTRFIFRAATAASKAADYVLDFSRRPVAVAA